MVQYLKRSRSESPLSAFVLWRCIWGHHCTHHLTSTKAVRQTLCHYNSSDHHQLWCEILHHDNKKCPDVNVRHNMTRSWTYLQPQRSIGLRIPLFFGGWGWVLYLGVIIQGLGLLCMTVSLRGDSVPPPCGDSPLISSCFKQKYKNVSLRYDFCAF